LNCWKSADPEVANGMQQALDLCSSGAFASIVGSATNIAASATATSSGNQGATAAAGGSTATASTTAAVKSSGSSKAVVGMGIVGVAALVGGVIVGF